MSNNRFAVLFFGGLLLIAVFLPKLFNAGAL